MVVGKNARISERFFDNHHISVTNIGAYLKIEEKKGKWGLDFSHRFYGIINNIYWIYMSGPSTPISTLLIKLLYLNIQDI